MDPLLFLPSAEHTPLPRSKYTLHRMKKLIHEKQITYYILKQQIRRSFFTIKLVKFEMLYVKMGLPKQRNQTQMLITKGEYNQK